MSSPSPAPAAGKREQVAAMFDRIAPRYDLLNRLLSGGVDVRWRKRALRMLGRALEAAWGRSGGHRLLDVATGTADLAIAAARQLEPAEVVGVDPSEGMLAFGREKVATRELDGVVTLAVGAAEALPFEDDAFDGALVAFGVRNFEDRVGGLRDMARVLKPGAPLVVLEFSQPRGPVAPLFGFYFRRVLPKIGGLISGDSGAYTYLHDSVQVFPDGDDFLTELAEAGFEPVRYERLTFGIASLYLGTARQGQR
jgi:demethylmenaquinone methyltransferase / 2-methoxy-6-polyprenyl-1,4-benzoquinol methylase